MIYYRNYRKRIRSSARYHCAMYSNLSRPVPIPYQSNISKVSCQFICVREGYAAENPEMLTSAVEKSIKTVATYRVLSFHGENNPFEDSLLCHKFECGPRHFDKQLCKLAGNTRHPGSQLKWQIKPRAPQTAFA